MRRPFAMTRRALRMPKGSTFVPTMVDGCCLWLYPGRVTTVDATTRSPNDVSTGDWFLNGLVLPRNPGTMFEDGTNGTHRVYQVPTNGLGGYPYTYYAEVRNNGASNRGIVFGDMSNVFGQVLLSNGATIGAANCTVHVGAQMAGGYWPISCVGTSNLGTAYTIMGCTLPNGTVSYAGDNVSGVDIRNVQVTQQHIAQWSDISGANNHATMAVAANRPLYLATGWDGVRPCVAGYGASWLSTPAHPIGPFARYITMRGTIGNVILSRGNATAEYLYGLNNATILVARGGNTSSKKLTAGLTAWATDNAARVIRHRFGGTHALHDFGVNGVTQAIADVSVTDPGLATVNGTLDLLARGDGVQGCTAQAYEVLEFNRYLNDSEDARVVAYLRATAGGI